MREVLLFVEDDAQEKFVGRLLERVARESGVALRVRVRSARGGWGQVLRELKSFHDSFSRGAEYLPDAICVAVDANCTGAEERRRLIDECTTSLREHVVCAIADPHIERWLLLDGKAFKDVLGRGCEAPDQKCEKGRYKRLLFEAVREAGIDPLLGGIEYAEELADRLDLARVAAGDPGFNRFLADLRATLKRLARSGG